MIGNPSVLHLQKVSHNCSHPLLVHEVKVTFSDLGTRLIFQIELPCNLVTPPVAKVIQKGPDGIPSAALKEIFSEWIDVVDIVLVKE